MKTIMPDEKTILERLNSVLDEGSDVGLFYKDFAKVANNTLTEQGVYLRWQLALAPYDSDPNGIPFFGALMMFDFERYMQALFPDNPDFVSAILDWHMKVTTP